MSNSREQVCSDHLVRTWCPRWKRWSRRKRISLRDLLPPRKLKWLLRRQSHQQQQNNNDNNCKPFAWLSHKAALLMSPNLIVPLLSKNKNGVAVPKRYTRSYLLEYMKRLQCFGWNSAEVITSVSSSILAGLMSTMSMRPSKEKMNTYCCVELTERLIGDP